MQSTTTRAGLGFGATLLLLTASCGSGAAERPRGVILICLDTVRADHLGCYGYAARDTTPALDRLAARSTLFLDASATAGWTKPSVPSFLTGTYPCQHGVYEGSARSEAGETSDVLPERATTLAEAFQAQGYATAAFVENAQLRRGSGIEQGFALYRDRAGGAAEIRRQAVGWLEERPREQPFFLYLHLLDAHMPYDVPDDWAQRYARDPAERERIARFRGPGWRELREAVNDGATRLSAEERAALGAVYDGALAYADAELGRLFDYLRERGLADQTVLAVIADHGEELGERGRIGHGHGLSETLLRVPWILHVPGLEPERVATPVSLIDLFPTLLAAAGAADPRTHMGLNRLDRSAGPAPIVAEHKAPGHHEQSLRRGPAKVLRRFDPPPAGTGAPPGELTAALGSRVELELERGADGELRATAVDPSADAPGDPAELKGTLERGDAHTLVLGGVELLVDGALELPPLVPGTLAKARLLRTDTALALTRLKLYPPGEAPDFELRGVIEAVLPDDAVAGAGRLAIAGLWVRYDAHTQRGSAGGGEGRLEREELAGALELGLQAAASAGWRVRIEGAELAGWSEAPAAADPALAAELDALAMRLVRARIFGSADRAALSLQEQRELQAIGYGH